MNISADIKITVIIPTYNPKFSYLAALLTSLKAQTYNYVNWELIIIDNNSNNSVLETIDFSWHPNAQMIKEPRQGLTHSRICGFKQAKGDIIIMADDDNILDDNYLENTLAIFNSTNALGAIGGKSIPQFETDPPYWLKEFYPNLALRDLGEDVLTASWQNEYPAIAPIGAGMAIKKTALKSYIGKITDDGNVIADRTGTELSSGGDNDIIIEILKSGWQVGYYPSLLLKHIIPENRMQINYLARLVNSSNKSWVQVLEKHGINPWHKIAVWTVSLRKIKAWFTYRVWQNKINYIKWKAACGMFEGQSLIKVNAKT